MSESLVWVDVPCPLCGQRHDEPILMVPTAQGTCRLARCESCRMVYLNPRPSEETLVSLYPEDYSVYQSAPEHTTSGPFAQARQHLRRLALAHYQDYPPGKQKGIRRALAPLGQFLLDARGESMTSLPWVGEGRLLDYGCGSGWFALRMRELGWRVTAMDFNPASAARVANRYRIPVVTGTLPQAKLTPESFDVVTMGCVLEHVHDPHALIEAAVRVLAPGGLLVATVPNINAWSFRSFGADWHGLDLPRHLLHFSPATLRQLVEDHGLEVQEIRQVPRPGWMRRSLKSSQSSSGVNLPRRVLRTVASWGPVTRLIGQFSAETRQADSMKLIAAKPTRAAVRLAA